MTDASARTPSPWLIAAVVLAHAVLLAGGPWRASPRPAPLPAPALNTRAIAAPRPPPAGPQPSAVAPSPASPPRTAPVRRPVATAPVRTAPVRRAPTHAGARPPSQVAQAEPAAAPVPSEAIQPTPAAADTAPPTAVRVPGPATLRYQVSGHARGLAYEARAELQWRRQGSRYEATWTVGLPLLGTRTQRSEGRITDGGLAPVRFGERSGSERAAHFDAEGGRIRFSANTPDAVLAPGAQDRLSVTLQLAALLAAAPERYPHGAQITIQTAGVRDAEPWVWEVLADETLPLAGRELPTAHLLRQPRREHDTRVELWLARTLDYLPVRLRLTLANGDVADQQLQAVDAAPAGP